MSQGLSDNQTTALILPFLPGSRSARAPFSSCCFQNSFFLEKNSEVDFVGHE
jgi:hypothetical protein